jgi:branched-chain amino acid transport system substrate-binding protein
LKPNCIFFAGTASNALILIRQIRAFAKSALMPAPMVILSDSAVDKNILASGGTDIDGTFLIYPWLAKEFATDQDGTKVIGRDARLVVDTLLEESSRKHAQIRKGHGWLGYSLRTMFGMHRAKDARNTIDSVIQRSMQDGTRYALSGDRKAQFTSKFKNEVASFHIWRVEAGRFQDVQ